MQAISGRGGASGVGVNLFFEGGVVWDGGHARTQGEALMPSSAQYPNTMPPLLARWEFPTEWRVALMLPPGLLANGEYERVFFQRNTPIPRVEALETLAIVCHGVIPAFVTRDLCALRLALRDLHEVGFKRRELLGQGGGPKSLLRQLQINYDMPIGMSSMGPLVYSILPASSQAEAEAHLRKASKYCTAHFIGVFPGWNAPHETHCQ